MNGAYGIAPDDGEWESWWIAPQKEDFPTIHQFMEENPRYRNPTIHKLGANNDVVKDSFLLHGIQEGHYLNVNKDYGGFGGTCLPKDTRAMKYLVDKLGLDLKLFETIIQENDKFVVKVPEGMRKEI